MPIKPKGQHSKPRVTEVVLSKNHKLTTQQTTSLPCILRSNLKHHSFYPTTLPIRLVTPPISL
jgi:hypothetical protein